MGSFFSLCRRTESDIESNVDNEPLLHGERGGLPPPRNPLDKLADVIAALNTGKLPSQDQINMAFRKLLKSEMFDINKRGRGYGPLSERGREVIGDLRELVEATLQFGLEKNDDDKLQDLVYQIRSIDDKLMTVDIDKDKNPELVEDMENLRDSIPSKKELDKDARRFTFSVFTLARLILTSQNFRYLLSDILLTFRSLVADVAGDVRSVAHTVEMKADQLEGAVRPEGNNEQEAKDTDWEDKAKHIGEDMKREIGKDAKADWTNLKGEAPDRTRKAAVDRMLKILNDAQRSPYYASALRVLVDLVHKYLKRLDTATTATLNISSEASSSTTSSPSTVIPATVAPDPHLSRAIEDFRTILERLASGYSISRFTAQFQKTCEEINNAAASSPTFKADLHRYFRDLEAALENALNNPAFASSANGRAVAEDLYDRGRRLMHSNGPWVQEADKTLDELDIFVQCLVTDKTTQRIVRALEKLGTHFASLFKMALGAAVGKQRAFRQELKADLLGWVLPRVLRLLKTLPIPRVEVKTDDIEAVLEGMVWEADASFVPDHVVVQNWSEIRLEASAAAPEPTSPLSTSASSPTVQTATRTHIHLDGLRISAHDIGYYMQYYGLCGLGWEDSGFMSVEVGRPGKAGEGVSIDLDLETSAQTDDGTISDSAFQVNNVKVAVPGLHFSLDESRHWILNKLLVQPLSAPIVQYVLSGVLESQIRRALEYINATIVEVRREAHRRVDWNIARTNNEPPTLEDYWNALCFVISSGVSPTEEEDTEMDVDYEDTVIESGTKVTMQGIVHESQVFESGIVTTPEPPESETIIAVGVGPQILPDRNPPNKDSVKTLREETVDAVRELSHAAGRAKDVGLEAVDDAAKIKDNAETAVRRKQMGEGLERRAKGWRSGAFEL
ncbi:hypothetical protein M422DRAFT_51984 [Sphaerobolus stellatus SS14]|uniref:Unplaced genomic scaffold SPHSTscaffold_123, whole genome shotgun sequence n=1 Tax=Sphaerobolus stellatus (strain SS14) TaxID=990650 RepID=A0A0C9UI91_SPHS4|nr:hypothetical protein M422DRAFT_51984 [Sphaerobolus stellatus SS14]